MTRRLLRLRRQRRVSDLARLLVALDTLAGDSRSLPARRVRRASVGAARI